MSALRPNGLVPDVAVRIIQRLQRRPMTKADLAVSLDVSQVTVQRGLDHARRSLGAPIRHLRTGVRGAGVWAIQSGYQIPWDRLPCATLRAKLRKIVGSADPFEVLRRAVQAGLHTQTKTAEISQRDLG